MTNQDQSQDPWKVFEYEVDMFEKLSCGALVPQQVLDSASPYLSNALAESRLLHIRILAELLLSRDNSKSKGDITLKKLLPAFSSPEIDAEIATLDSLYGKSNKRDSACWKLNKLLAHATYFRVDSYDYTPLVDSLTLPIQKLIDQVKVERDSRNPARAHG
jgi:hypothetical protein